MRAITVTLLIQEVATGSAWLDSLCLHCGGGLDWQLPDPDLPERLLGVCLDCKRWHLLSATCCPDDPLLSTLPEPAELRERRDA